MRATAVVAFLLLAAGNATAQLSVPFSFEFQDSTMEPDRPLAAGEEATWTLVWQIRCANQLEQPLAEDGRLVWNFTAAAGAEVLGSEEQPIALPQCATTPVMDGISTLTVRIGNDTAPGTSMPIRATAALHWSEPLAEGKAGPASYPETVQRAAEPREREMAAPAADSGVDAPAAAPLLAIAFAAVAAGRRRARGSSR